MFTYTQWLSKDPNNQTDREFLNAPFTQTNDPQGRQAGKRYHQRLRHMENFYRYTWYLAAKLLFALLPKQKHPVRRPFLHILSLGCYGQLMTLIVAYVGFGLSVTTVCSYILIFSGISLVLFRLA